MRTRKVVKKSAAKSAGGKPFAAGADERRGNGPAKGAPNAGRPPDEFKAMMRALASRDETLERLRAILRGYVEVTQNDGTVVRVPVDSDTYLKALAFATDRGYGKAQQHMDVTSGGESLTPDAVAKMTPAEIRAEIAKRMAAK